MSERHGRTESIIHRGAQSVISEGFSDPRLEGSMITITQVSVDRDATTAMIRVSVMPREHEKRVIAGLASAAKHIRRRTADRVNVHRMPHFRFAIDKGAKRQADVLEALARARAESEDLTENNPQDHAAQRDDAADRPTEQSP
jgi:ribosome-binding factor A